VQLIAPYEIARLAIIIILAAFVGMGRIIVAEEKMVGTVKSFDVAKGYGYIEAADLQQPVFVHYESTVDDRYRMLKAGEMVEFLLDDAPEGSRAVEVKKL